MDRKHDVHGEKDQSVKMMGKYAVLKKEFEFFDILRILIRDVNGKTCAAAFYALNVFALRMRRLPAPALFISVAVVVKDWNISAALFAAGI